MTQNKHVHVNGTAPKVRTTPGHATPVASQGNKKPDEVRTLSAQIMAVLSDDPAEAMTNAEIRKALAMRSSRSKGQGKTSNPEVREAELAKAYKALHPTMKKLTKAGLVKFYKKGNANAYYRAPASPEPNNS